MDLAFDLFELFGDFAQPVEEEEEAETIPRSESSESFLLMDWDGTLEVQPNSLHYAINHSKAKEILKFLEENPTINVNDKISVGPLYDREAVSPLILACSLDKEEAFNVLLESGADLNVPGEKGWLPIHVASARRSAAICRRILLENKENVNSRTPDGLTPLMIAAYNGRIENIKVLLEHSPELDAISSSGKGILYFAVQRKHEGAVKLLLEAGVPVLVGNQKKYNVIRLATKKNWYYMLNIILQACPKTIINKDSLEKAMAMRHFTAAAALIRAGIDPNTILPQSTKPTCLHIAAASHSVNISLALLGRGAKIDALDDGSVTPLFTSARSFENEGNSIDEIDLLLQYGPNPRIRGPGRKKAENIAEGHGRRLISRYRERYWGGTGPPALKWICTWYIRNHAQLPVPKAVSDAAKSFMTEEIRENLKFNIEDDLTMIQAALILLPTIELDSCFPARLYEHRDRSWHEVLKKKI